METTTQRRGTGGRPGAPDRHAGTKGEFKGGSHHPRPVPRTRVKIPPEGPEKIARGNREKFSGFKVESGELLMGGERRKSIVLLTCAPI